MLRALNQKTDAAIVHRLGGPRQPPTRREFAVQTAICTVFIVGCFFGFTGRNIALASRGYAFFCPVSDIDALVPFVPAFVVVYVLFYPTFFAIALVTTRDRRVMYMGVIAYVTCASVSLIVFALVPSQMIQPVPACSGVFCDVLTGLRGLDHDFHVFPSLHVAYPLCVWFFFRRYAPALATVLVIECILIPFSTVLLKRHVLLDLPPGLILGAASAYVGFALGPRYQTFMTRIGLGAPTTKTSGAAV